MPLTAILHRPLSWSVALCVTSVLALSLAACGDRDDANQPQASDLPAGAVAVVGDVEISQGDLRRRAAAMRRSQSTGTGGQNAGPAGAALRQQALSTLLLSAALEQEAAERGIEVRDADVRRRWTDAAKQQFRTRKALRRFLRGQTLQDVLDQLRIQVLTERVHAEVSEEAGGGKDGARAVKEFQREFDQRWRERTACKQGQAAGLCAGS